jgi:hypothetical protein
MCTAIASGSSAAAYEEDLRNISFHRAAMNSFERDPPAAVATTKFPTADGHGPTKDGHLQALEPYECIERNVPRWRSAERIIGWLSEAVVRLPRWLVNRLQMRRLFVQVSHTRAVRPDRDIGPCRTVRTW